MKIYMVGGAVRDSLLNLPIKDRDWVVVGATPEIMIQKGYQQIGYDFPVFLHPKSHEEYALARTERKFNFGYKGFICYAASDVTLEEDLFRRDLTINALAKEDNGRIIDLYNGKKDLKNRLLRHISSTFSEDPLRVLRVARFAACYAHLNFRVADETMELMKVITNSGELKYLTPERIWKETKSALSSLNPQIYFQILRDCGALKVLFPELDDLFAVPLLDKWNSETNIGIHTLLSLNKAAVLSSSVEVRFAILCQNLDKGIKTKQKYLQNNDNFLLKVKLTEQLCKRLRVPNEIQNLAKLVSQFHDLVHIFHMLDPASIIKLFDNIDAWRKPYRIEQIALIFETSNYLQSNLLREAWETVKSVQTKTIIAAGFKGFKIREELTKRRIQAISSWKEKRFS